MAGVDSLSFASQVAGCAALAVFAALLVVAAAIDVRTRRIPNALSVVGACVWAAARAALGVSGGAVSLAVDGALSPWGLTAADGVVGALALGGGVLVVSIAFEALFGRDSMGGGDVKLLAVVGLYFGWERGLTCLFAACVVVVAAALAQRALGKKPAGAFPFAPAILAGAVVAAAL